MNAVTSLVTGILGGQTNLQAATNALAPYAAELIGKQFGHGDNQNQAAQLVAHALLGALSASINGGNAAAGAVGASAAELAAQYLIKQLPKDKYPGAIDPITGEIDPNRLPENVKASIRDLSSAVATVSGGLTGGSLTNAQIAGVVGQNAVENNYLLIKDKKGQEAFLNVIQPNKESSALKLNFDKKGRLVPEGYHYETINGIVTLVADDPNNPVPLSGSNEFEKLLIQSMQNPDVNPFPLAPNYTVFVDSYADHFWDPSDFNTPNINDINAGGINNDYQDLANQLLMAQPLAERLSTIDYMKNSEEFLELENQKSDILRKYQANSFQEVERKIRMQLMLTDTNNPEYVKLQNELNRIYQINSRMKQQSSQFHQAGEQAQLNIMKERFPDLANQMSSSNIKLQDYVVNGKVVGVIEDFGAVQFIMYTDPRQRRIIRTEFKFK